MDPNPQTSKDDAGEIKTQRPLSRREFLGGAAGVAGAVAAGCIEMASVSVVPSSVLGKPRHIAPSEKINIAGIGAGGQAGVDLMNLSKLGQNIVALCDVDWDRGGWMFAVFKEAARYRDFRIMLQEEDKNIDAVVVAIPDHMHAPAALMAMRMGKHCYCEKPLAHTVREAREMAQVAKEAGVATQMGNQGQASERVRSLTEYIAAGAIGKVKEVHNWCDRPRAGHPWPQAIERPEDTPTPPENLSWDLWLGVAPDRPYHPAYLPFKWRGWYDFGTGALGDIGCHSFYPIFKALDLGYPTHVAATTTELHAESYPLVSMIQYTFPARSSDYPEVKLTWYDGLLHPPRPLELESERAMGGGGTLYVGDEGKLFNGRIIPESKHQEFPKPEETIPRSPGHYEEFVEACKGGPPAGANFEYAAKVTESVLLGNVALKAERPLEWDTESMRVTNYEEANKFLTKTYPGGWGMPT